MKKLILFLVLLISFFLLPSIVHALSLKNIIPLDMVSNFFNNILGTSGSTPTTTTIPTETCDSTCKNQGYSSGSCKAGTSSTRLMGANSAGRWKEINVTHIDLLKNSGGNTYFFDTFLNYWRDNPSEYRTKVAQIRQWCKDRNITFIVSIVGTQWAPSEGWNQMRGNIIFNVSGAQDYYFNISEQMIRNFQPDIWHILDEPIWEGTQWNQTTFFNGYREFCIKAMQRLKAIKPDLKFVATSIPFWDMHPIAANPIPGMDYYLYAYYYMQNSYPPSWEPGLQAYWTATTSSELANAKQIQWNRWLDNAGLQECINKGLRIIDFGGSYSLNTIDRSPTPNCMQYMEDYYQFCDKYNFDFIVLTLMPDTQSGLSENGEYFYGLGMLEGTGWKAGATYPAKLNGFGQLWAKNMLAAGSVTATCQSGESSIGQDGCSSNNLCCCSGTATQKCSDGTQYGQCSSTKPKYCDNGNLINKCSQCDCYSGYSCNSTTNACYIPVTSTCDSTCKVQGYTTGTCKSGTSSPTGMLHVCGTKICDENDNSFVFRGV